jgi:hypothetical protein
MLRIPVYPDPTIMAFSQDMLYAQEIPRGEAIDLDEVMACLRGYEDEYYED